MPMKKSTGIILSAVMIAAVAACRQKDEWINGNDATGRYRDTAIGGNRYRYYRGGWFPIFHNQISPSTYRGGSGAEIASPGYHPVRSGGFGRSAHSSSHASAGE